MNEEKRERKGLGVLKRQDFERLASAIKAKRRPCPLCGEDDWAFAGEYVNLWMKPSEEGKLADFMVLLPMICQSCGNTHLLFPNYLGVDAMDLSIYENPRGR